MTKKDFLLIFKQDKRQNGTIVALIFYSYTRFEFQTFRLLCPLYKNLKKSHKCKISSNITKISVVSHHENNNYCPATIGHPDDTNY